jgi:hypothetical protein
MSEAGMKRSFGICVNYEYNLEQVAELNKVYLVEHRVTAAEEASCWLQAGLAC